MWPFNDTAWEDAMQRLEESRTINEVWGEGYKIGFNCRGEVTFISERFSRMPNVKTRREFEAWRAKEIDKPITNTFPKND